jgi:hypothetical protein
MNFTQAVELVAKLEQRSLEERRALGTVSVSSRVSVGHSDEPYICITERWAARMGKGDATRTIAWIDAESPLLRERVQLLVTMDLRPSAIGTDVMWPQPLASATGNE